VLKVFSEDVVEERGSRTADELAQASNLKESFRQYALHDIGTMLHELYENPNLRHLVLNVLTTYIEWIPIELSMTFLEKIIACVVQQEQENWRVAAFGCISAYVEKKMDAEKKLKILGDLNIIPFL
jgi:hypothetical protein